MSGGGDRRFVFYGYKEGTGLSLIGHIDSNAGNHYGGEAVPVSIGSVCYVYGLGDIAAKIDGGVVSTISDPIPAIEGGATGAAGFQYFFTSDAMYIVRGWYHSGRDENYKVIYKVGPDGAEFAYKTSGSFELFSAWSNLNYSWPFWPCSGFLSGYVMWFRAQSWMGNTSFEYSYQSLDLVSGATSTGTPPNGVVFPQPYEMIENAWVSHFHYAWGNDEYTDSMSNSANHKSLLYDEYGIGGNPESFFVAYPIENVWATSLTGHGLPSVMYTDLTYLPNGFSRHLDTFPAIYSVFSPTAATPVWTPWWKNKTGVIEVAT